MDSPDCLLLLLSISVRFLLFTFSVFTLLVVGSVWQIKHLVYRRQCVVDRSCVRHPAGCVDSRCSFDRSPEPPAKYADNTHTHAHTQWCIAKNRGRYTQRGGGEGSEGTLLIYDH